MLLLLVESRTVINSGFSAVILFFAVVVSYVDISSVY